MMMLNDRIYYEQEKILKLTTNGIEYAYKILNVREEDSETVIYDAYEMNTNTRGVLRMYYPSVKYDSLWFDRKENSFLISNEKSAEYEKRQKQYVSGYERLAEDLSTASEKHTIIIANLTKDMKILTPIVKEKSVLSGVFDKIKKGTDKKNFTSVSPVYIWSSLEADSIDMESYISVIKKDPEVLSLNKIFAASDVIDEMISVMTFLTDNKYTITTFSPRSISFKYNKENFLIDKDSISISGLCSVYNEEFKPEKKTDRTSFDAPETMKGEYSFETNLYSLASIFYSSLVERDGYDGLYSDFLYDVDVISIFITKSKLIQHTDGYSKPLVMKSIVDFMNACLCQDPRERIKDKEQLRKHLTYIKGGIFKHIADDNKKVAEARKKFTERNVDLLMQKCLYDYPLFNYVTTNSDESTRKEINILTIGAGEYAQKFIDVSLQLSQIPGYKVKVIALSPKSELDKESYLQSRPALTDFVCVNGEYTGLYRNNDIPMDVYAELNFLPMVEGDDTKSGISFVLDDETTNKELTREIHERYKEYHYIFVSLGEDKLNQEISGYYREVADSNCIVTYTSELKKYAKSKNASSGNGVLHAIHLGEKIDETSIDERLIQIAFNTHISWYDNMNYDRNKVRKEFYNNKYNFNSSIAFALSIVYKLYAIGIDVNAEKYIAEVENFLSEAHHSGKKSEKKRVYLNLIAYEHRRWVLDRVCDGWNAPKIKDENGNYIYDEQGNPAIDYSLCASGDGVKNEVLRLHPCIVHSCRDLPLEESDFNSNHHSKWDDIDVDINELDALDRLSICLHREFKKKAEEVKKSRLMDSPEMQDIVNMVLYETKKLEFDERDYIEQELYFFQFCIKNMLADYSKYCQQYSQFKDRFLKSVRKLGEYSYKRIEGNVKTLTNKLYPVIEYNMYRNYKNNDLKLIDKLPFVLSYQDKKTLGVYLNVDGDFSVSKFVDNIAASLLLCPEKIVLFCKIDKERITNAKNYLGKILSMFEKRNMACDIVLDTFFSIDFLDADSILEAKSFQNQLKVLVEKYDGKMRLKKAYEGTVVKFSATDIKLKSKDEIDDAIFKYIKNTKKIEYFDLSQLDDFIMDKVISLDSCLYFRFDSANMKFDVSGKLNYLKYMNHFSTSLRIEELADIKDSKVEGFSIPEGLEYVESLWDAYTHSYINPNNRNKEANLSLTRWRKFIGMLENYHAGETEEKIVFTKNRRQDTDMEVLVPGFSYGIMTEIMHILKEKEVISKSSCLYGTTGDNVVVHVISEYNVEQSVLKLVALGEYLRERYITLSGEETEDKLFISVNRGYDHLQVRELAFRWNGSNNDQEAFSVYKALCKTGLIYPQVSPEESKNNKNADGNIIVSFRYNCARLKEILLKKGEILELFVYDKLIKSELFDDILWSFHLYKSDQDGAQDEIDCILIKGFKVVFIECKAKGYLDGTYSSNTQEEIIQLSEKVYEKLDSRTKYWGCNELGIMCWHSYNDTMPNTDYKKINDKVKQNGYDRFGISTISEITDIENLDRLINDLL